MSHLARNIIERIGARSAGPENDAITGPTARRASKTRRPATAAERRTSAVTTSCCSSHGLSTIPWPSLSTSLSTGPSWTRHHTSTPASSTSTCSCPSPQGLVSHPRILQAAGSRSKDLSACCFVQSATMLMRCVRCLGYLTATGVRIRRRSL